MKKLLIVKQICFLLCTFYSLSITGQDANNFGDSPSNPFIYTDSAYNYNICEADGSNNNPDGEILNNHFCSTYFDDHTIWIAYEAAETSDYIQINYEGPRAGIEVYLVADIPSSDNLPSLNLEPFNGSCNEAEWQLPVSFCDSRNIALIKVSTKVEDCGPINLEILPYEPVEFGDTCDDALDVFSSITHTEGFNLQEFECVTGSIEVACSQYVVNDSPLNDLPTVWYEVNVQDNATELYVSVISDGEWDPVYGIFKGSCPDELVLATKPGYPGYNSSLPFTGQICVPINPSEQTTYWIGLGGENYDVSDDIPTFEICVLILGDRECNVTFEDFNSYEEDGEFLDQVDSSTWIPFYPGAPPSFTSNNRLHLSGNESFCIQSDLLHILNLNSPGVVDLRFDYFNECSELVIEFIESYNDHTDFSSIGLIRIGSINIGQLDSCVPFIELEGICDNNFDFGHDGRYHFRLDFNTQLIHSLCDDVIIQSFPFAIEAEHLYGIGFGTYECAIVNNICINEEPYSNTLSGNISIEQPEDCTSTQQESVAINFYFIQDQNIVLTRKIQLINSQSYSMSVPDGTYDIEIEYPDNPVAEITPSTFTATFEGGNTVTQDIDVNYTNITDANLSIDISFRGFVRPGSEFKVRMKASNIGGMAIDGMGSLQFDPDFMTLLDLNADYTLDGNKILFSLGELCPGETVNYTATFESNTPTSEPPLIGGERLEFIFNVNETLEDKIRLLVLNSFDPNSKVCLNGENIVVNGESQFVDYLIQFENLGNGTAFEVKIEDQIDTTVFDISTFTLIETSHSVVADVSGDMIEFYFDNIRLGTDGVDSEGHVIFKMLTKSELRYGDLLDNSADIFFDLNPPITTELSRTIVLEDIDLDGFHNLEDCDDNNPSVNPASVEIPYNGMDDDCNPITLDDDLDEDGFGILLDCNDQDPTVNSNSEEIIYNGIDDDCNPDTLDDDLDGDGFVLLEDCDDSDSSVFPQASCDDGDDCTIEDTYDTDCYCIGVILDTDEDGVCDAEDITDGDCVLGGSCDDGDDCTINDSYNSTCDCIGTFLDSDQDGVCDAEDETVGDCELGNSCDDGDNCTINDAYDSDCNCIGIFQDSDQDGICDVEDETNGDCELGSNCDDGDICTVQDKYDTDCNCIGEFRDSDGDGICNAEDCRPFNENVYPGNMEIPYNSLDDDCDPNTLDDDLDQDGFDLLDDCDDTDPTIYINASCDDGDECTINDVYNSDCNCIGLFQDADDDGICDLDDDTNGDCALGESCDDGDVCTVNDTYDSDCNCIGLFQDGDDDGICDEDDQTDGECVLGSACDDDDACTTNDAYDSDCNCIGLFQDSDQDGICDADDNTNGDCLLGAICDDNNPETGDGTFDENCNCSDGEPIDCIGEAGGDAIPGSPCDDTDDCTENDTYTEDCICIGELLPLFTYFQDQDGDGYGQFETITEICDENPPEGFADNGLDCDDNNPDINPDAEDIPNNDIDEDCDGNDALSSTHNLNGEKIDIYPNPVSHLLQVESAIGRSYALQLIDTQGKLIMKSTGVNSIDCSALTEGTYLLKVIDVESGDFVVERVMVVH